MGIAKPDCDTLYRTENMSERKALIAQLADAFVALPGGFGTIEEFSEVLTAKHLGTHNKAIVLLNLNGFYDHLIKWFEHLYGEKFANQSYKESFYVATSVKQTMDYLYNYKAPVSKNKY